MGNATPQQRSLRLGTRGSQLARWQADWVAGELRRFGHAVELVEITTHGDADRSRPIESIGTQGVFTKAIQQALLAGEVDLAVHSLKDLPTAPVPGLTLAAVPPRESAADVLVLNADAMLRDDGSVSIDSLLHSSSSQLPRGARVGTGSLRRQAQLRHVRPDLVIEEIRGNVERLLQARVGPGKAVVEVSVDLVTDHERLTERRFDPQGRVAISSETEQKSGNSQQGDSGVSVASNLPEGDAAAGQTDRSQSSESRERVNYEVSETSREVERPPGAIRRLSVAVLIDGEPVAAADGTTTIQPRGEAELAVLRDLVASAVGLDEARGDILTVKSLPFPQTPAEGTALEAGLLPPLSSLDLTALAQAAVLAAVVLGLGLFVLRPVLLSARRPAELPAPPAALALPGSVAGTAVAGMGRVLDGVIDDGELPRNLPVLEEPDAADLPPDPVARLRRLIEQRQTETVEILRGWMEADEETA